VGALRCCSIKLQKNISILILSARNLIQVLIILYFLASCILHPTNNANHPPFHSVHTTSLSLASLLHFSLYNIASLYRSSPRPAEPKHVDPNLVSTCLRLTSAYPTRLIELTTTFLHTINRHHLPILTKIIPTSFLYRYLFSSPSATNLVFASRTS
jgi:hypothetical protein